MYALDSTTAATPAAAQITPDEDPFVMALRAAISPSPVATATSTPAVAPVKHQATVLFVPEPAPAPAVEQVEAVVTQTVTVQPVARRTDLNKAEADWTWQELCDYVTSQIESRFGVFPRNSKKEYGIFNRFMKEHGADAVLIAKAAFEVHNGWWGSSPIRIERFCRASDPFFALPILTEIRNAQ